MMSELFPHSPIILFETCCRAIITNTRQIQSCFLIDFLFTVFFDFHIAISHEFLTPDPVTTNQDYAKIAKDVNIFKDCESLKITPLECISSHVAGFYFL